jgi:dephospho-CoA kinase
MTEQDARARASTQASDAEREAAADIVVHNEGDLDRLRREADRVWADLVARPSAPSH